MAPADETDNDTLVTRLRTWLGTEGYPLEFQVARTLRAVGYRVRQGEYVRDQLTDSLREIDVFATRARRTESALICAHQVIECKYSRGKPWLVFSSKDDTPSAASIAGTLGTEAARAILWANAGHQQLQELAIFRSPVRSGFSGRQAFSGGNDMFYGACQSVVSAAAAMVAWDEEEESLERWLRRVIVAFPILVVDGKLFEVFDSDEAPALNIEPRSQIRVHWRGAEHSEGYVPIDIVTVEALPSFAEMRRIETDALLAELETGQQRLHAAFEASSFRPLSIGKRPSGMGSAPSLLQELRRRVLAQRASHGPTTAVDGAEGPEAAPVSQE